LIFAALAMTSRLPRSFCRGALLVRLVGGESVAVAKLGAAGTTLLMAIAASALAVWTQALQMATPLCRQ